MKTGRIQPGYGMIQRKVMCSPEISVFSKAVYCLLVSYAGDKESCFPSLRTMCDNLQISKPTIIKSLKELIATGFIVADKARTKLGEHANNIYYPMYIMDEGVVNDVDQGGQLDLQGVVNDVDTKNNNIKKPLSKDKVPAKRFSVPSVNEIDEYFKEKGCVARGQEFFDFYESKGWMVGSNKMKDWKAAVRTWINKGKEKSKNEPSQQKIQL